MDIDIAKLGHFVPLESLDDTALQELGNLVEISTFPKESQIFNFGDADEEFIYLIEGEVALTSKDGDVKTIHAKDDQARYPLANLKPRQFKGVIRSDQAVVMSVDGQTLERMLAWGNMPSGADGMIEISEGDSYESTVTQDMDWTLALLRTKAFLQLPSSNIEKLFDSFEPVPVREGEMVIKFGEPGDYYYIIQEGSCKVTRPTARGEIKLAELHKFDSFGEDALIADEPRNATITMLSDGLLLRLSKEKFSTLLKAPLVKTFAPFLNCSIFIRLASSRWLRRGRDSMGIRRLNLWASRFINSLSRWGQRRS
jgi:CRP-like cAMP-binding protein